MKAYQNKQTSYFGTPPVNLIIALEKSLDNILKEGLNTRFERHKHIATEIRIALKNLGLKMIPKRESIAANTLSAIFYPENMDASILKSINEKGVILAGGLLPELKNSYFRIGHMGATNESQMKTTLNAITAVIQEK